MGKLPRKPLYVFFGHHKGATGWIDSILRETCFHLGWTFRIVHRPVDFASHGSLGALVRAERPDFLAYTNADVRDVASLPPFRGFHIVRDPRDIIVSGYFSHRNSHPTDGWPELAAHRQRLREVSKEEGLFLEMEFSRERLDQMRAWDYTSPSILELKMEELVADPPVGFAEIFAFLGLLDRSRPDLLRAAFRSLAMQANVLNQRGRRHTLGVPLWPFRIPLHTLPEPRVRAIVERRRFERLSGGRHQGDENVNSHYRKGQPGDWRNHFTEAHRAYFEQEFRDLLLKLGYAVGQERIVAEE